MASTASATSATNDTMSVPVVEEQKDERVVGEFLGQCKWFNDRLGYGFLTVQAGEKKGVDIFVHHSGLKPLNSNYKTLFKGEYVNFNIIQGDHGLQGVHITGVAGGSLMCDVLPSRRTVDSGISSISSFIPEPTGANSRTYGGDYPTGPRDRHAHNARNASYGSDAVYGGERGGRAGGRVGGRGDRGRGRY